MRAQLRRLRRRDHNAFVAANPAHAAGWCPWLISQGRMAGPPCAACLARMRRTDRAKWEAHYAPTIAASVTELPCGQVQRAERRWSRVAGPVWPEVATVCESCGRAGAVARAYFPDGAGFDVCSGCAQSAVADGAQSLVGLGAR